MTVAIDIGHGLFVIRRRRLFWEADVCFMIDQSRVLSSVYSAPCFLFFHKVDESLLAAFGVRDRKWVQSKINQKSIKNQNCNSYLRGLARGGSSLIISAGDVKLPWSFMLKCPKVVTRFQDIGKQ